MAVQQWLIVCRSYIVYHGEVCVSVLRLKMHPTFILFCIITLAASVLTELVCHGKACWNPPLPLSWVQSALGRMAWPSELSVSPTSRTSISSSSDTWLCCGHCGHHGLPAQFLFTPLWWSLSLHQSSVLHHPFTFIQQLKKQDKKQTNRWLSKKEKLSVWVCMMPYPLFDHHNTHIHNIPGCLGELFAASEPFYRQQNWHKCRKYI